MKFRLATRATRIVAIALFASIFFAELKAQDTLNPAKQAPISAALLSRVNSVIDADTARLIAVFKDLHEHPEIGFTEKRTAAIVAKELKALGFAVTEGVGKTGVVGVLKNGRGPTLWFRADMDSNSVHETTGLPYAATSKQRLEDGSEIDVMHACGHDAHVTWLLGLAKAMAALKEDWSGTLVRLCAARGRNRARGPGHGRGQAMATRLSEARLCARRTHGTRSGRLHFEFSGRKNGGHRSARHHVRWRRRPRFDSADDDRPGGHGCAGGAGISDDRQSQP